MDLGGYTITEVFLIWVTSNSDDPSRVNIELKINLAELSADRHDASQLDSIIDCGQRPLYILLFPNPLLVLFLF